MEKKRKLRHAEYYGTQGISDDLYRRSLNGENFYKLTELAQNEDNIRFAYRNIKKNHGSSTAGIDGLTIGDIKGLEAEKVVQRVQAMFANYRPQAVRRVFIPKPNGDQRPLGIPTILDRIFQQCILQVLEPICEAKFFGHSYGIRPNRSTHHALARMQYLINKSELHYCVDIDIKGFFDNVNHGKLLKQLWSLGIKDKSLICIVSKLLKAEIQGEGSSQKGTPQGGILSPLLSNIVLNELDWWVASQWECFNTKHTYNRPSAKFSSLKKTKLKEGYIIRYADDFKILCRSYDQARRFYIAVQDFLRSRLGLEISPEKSRVINLRRRKSNFLGFEIWVGDQRNGTSKARQRRYNKTKRKLVARSRMSDKAKANAIKKINAEINKIQHQPTTKTVWNFNTVVMGIQNYYAAATQIIHDLGEINRLISPRLFNRLRNKRKEALFSDMPASLQKRYKGYSPKLYKISGLVLVPIYAQKHRTVMNFNQKTSNFTPEGRLLIHNNLMTIDQNTLHNLRNSFVRGRSIEYNDNRISRFIVQRGKCAVTGVPLLIGEVHCHHILPKKFGGSDAYCNLLIVHEAIHRAIHMSDEGKITQIFNRFELSKNKLELLNGLRAKAHRKPIFSVGASAPK
ncbi:group II intron reverse transcriptase/maturase [Brevibacillus centrosporus]|uniref:group II intron reverse transcriptase/maturase n=1 Tax=Brevibacillus centrosporus TaxID=54910 RepID=UPI001141219C|nr:group II intron reverse transcriptase/maturase [Brevibacillus centrosporus]MEC2129362.1 group II intron reverse transcriptase/maturase [Brevibacillus centrosporus]GED33533.1 group II intron reverse transcriptase/maturase [Brevibacillus centrosporus]